MPYVKRDDQGRITTVNLDSAEGLENVPPNAPDLLDFMKRMGLEHSTLQQSDMRLVR
ncbi:MAG: hypothetical protein QG595_1350, partial [Pseudomonadota bacterium]|nr:hypothetical protein [Pseudomonadota bacterium]